MCGFERQYQALLVGYCRSFQKEVCSQGFCLHNLSPFLAAITKLQSAARARRATTLSDYISKEWGS